MKLLTVLAVERCLYLDNYDVKPV